MERGVRISSFQGPWGPIWLAFTSRGLCGLSLRGGREDVVRRLRSRWDDCVMETDPRARKQVIPQLREYFQGRRRRFQLPLDLRGTPFQIAVWKALMEIPFGETRSYQDVAVRVKRPLAMRAVGQANGRNPIPIIVPCHRVIRSSGELGGYGGGLDLKRRLLELEARAS